MATINTTFIKQSIETELGSMQTRARLAVGNCNRIKNDIPKAIKWKKILLELEQEIHEEWQSVANKK